MRGEGGPGGGGGRGGSWPLVGNTRKDGHQTTTNVEIKKWPTGGSTSLHLSTRGVRGPLGPPPPHSVLSDAPCSCCGKIKIMGAGILMSNRKAPVAEV